MEPLIFEDFDGPYADSLSPDGIWRLAGPWTGTGGNWLDPNLTEVSEGELSLTVAANERRGSEIQTLDGYSYGYYETSMKVSDTPGVVNSFFIIAEGYDPGTLEIDVEFLTNEDWIDDPESGQVHFVLHPLEQQHVVDLGFNPTLEFHRYGFLWEPGKVSYTVDGEIVAVFEDPVAETSADAYIMMNAWTGNPNWGGGPPSQDATSHYDFVKFYEGVTNVITTVRGTGGNDALAGGTNVDVFEASTGDDAFRNFMAEVDYIDFSAFGSLRASDVSASLVDGNLRLSFDDNTITIDGVSELAAGATSLGVAFDPVTSDPAPEPTNTAPEARDDSGLTTAHETPITVAAGDLLENDVDADGDSLELTGVSGGSGGTISLNDAGNVVFSPNADFSGMAQFTYSVSDGNGGTDTAKVFLAVDAAPTPDPEPSASDDGAGLWEDGVAPAARTDSDTDAVELGMKFLVDTDGEIAAIQFYETAESNGSHPVSLWTADGELLATEDFGGGSGAGWREVAFDEPVEVQAGETYVASYHSPQGRYAATEDFFWQSVDGDGVSAPKNAGVYAYGAAGSFPDQTYRASNYWVDVVFTEGAVEEDGSVTLPAPTMEGTDADNWMRGTSDDDVILGGKGNDTIIGKHGDDVLRGQDGDDRLRGHRDSDMLIGGRGDDDFVFRSIPESNWKSPDEIRAGDGAIAFESAGVDGGDIIDIARLDADHTVDGNQAFMFGSSDKGGLWLTDVDGRTLVSGNTDGDALAEFQVWIDDGRVTASDYTATDFIL